MKIAPSLDFAPGNLNTYASFVQLLQKLYRNLALAFNGHISFGDGTNTDNVDGVWQMVTFPSANTDVTIAHNLGRVPAGYLVMTKSQAGDVYTGSVAATKTQITLRSSTAGLVASIFIL